MVRMKKDAVKSLPIKSIRVDAKMHERIQKLMEKTGLDWPGVVRLAVAELAERKGI